MRKIKVCIALLLSFSIVSLTACGAKEVAVENDENIVEVDFGSLTNIDSIIEPVQSEFEDSSSSESQEEISSAEEETDSKEETVYIPGIPANLTWFDDCVFMGDSLTLGLSMYNDLTGDLGNAKFVCSPGLGWVNSQWSLDDENEVHPMYNGEKILLEDAVVLTESKKAIIGLGMNDIGIYGIEETLSSAEEFISKLKAKTPHVEIYLQTITPMLAETEYDRLNNPLIREYNDALEIFAKEQNCKFINSWEAIADENGKLPYDICEDPDSLGLHLTGEGCEIWKDCILKSIY